MKSLASYFSTRYKFYLIIICLALVGYHLLATIDYGIARVNGNIYFLIDDDMMISMRYARNLAAGNGLVFNVGERVEGFSNPLSTFLAAGFHFLPLSPTIIPGLIQFSSLLFSLGIVIIASRFWGTRPLGLVMGLIGAAFYLALPNHAFHAHSGYEVYMLMLVMLASIWGIEKTGFPGAAVLGLLPLIHSIASPLWLFLILAMFLASKFSVPKRLALVFVAILPFAAYEIFRITYFGDVQANTYWLKVNGGTWQSGLQYTLDWLGSVLLLLPFALYGLFAKRETRVVVMSIAIGVQIATTIVVGGDIFPQYRFLFPASLLLAVAAGRGAVLVLMGIGQWAQTWRRAMADRGIVAFAALVILVLPVVDYGSARDELERRKDWNLQHLAEGIVVRENTSPRTVVALFALGYSGYYSERTVIDMLGKTDRHIARVAPVLTRQIGHNKTDFDYVLGRSPDYVECWLTTEELQDSTLLREVQRDAQDGYLADLAFNQIFREVYLPNPVRDNSGRQLSFYARPGLPAQWSLKLESASAGSETMH